jgi:hypothetical protein
MNTKLTLKLDEEAIRVARKYADEHGQSISRLVETYFQSLAAETPQDYSAMPTVVGSLRGIVDSASKLDSKTEYREHLSEKYGR